MKAYLAGLWDGVNLWLQWEDVARDQGYEVQVRIDRTGWKEWRSVLGVPYNRCWAVLPTYAEGCTAQARVRVVGTEEWTECEEAFFKKCRCQFEISSSRRALHLVEGTHFTTTVDGAAATYILQEEIEIEEGGSAQVEMVACQSTGFCQLDYPGHFQMRPSLGVQIRNTAPSVDDIEATGRDHTVLTRSVPDGPTIIAFGSSLLHQ